MNLLLVTDGDKSHYVYIKDFDRFVFHKTKNKCKNYFCESCSQCFSSKSMLTKEQFSLKIISNKYQFHLKFMLILSVI